MDNGTFKIKYTELIDEVDELESEMVVKTKSIQYTLERLMEGRNIVKVDIKQISK